MFKIDETIAHVTCFCETCQKKMGNAELQMKGKPPKVYALPMGWVRFGWSVGLDLAEMVTNSIEDWHVAYHGTTPSVVPAILKTNQLVKHYYNSIM